MPRNERDDQVRLGDLYATLDPMWVEHGYRVGTLARGVARRFELTEQRTDRLEIAARLHDVGKAQIDSAILAKPADLSAGEWAVVREHPQLGYDVIRGAVHPEISLMVLSHHERFDGGGYPHGLSGARIPIGARILAVVDAFDAMVSDRSYQRAISIDAAIDELRRCAGTQFDPDVIEIVTFVLEGDLPEIPSTARESIFA